MFMFLHSMNKVNLSVSEKNTTGWPHQFVGRLSLLNDFFPGKYLDHNCNANVTIPAHSQKTKYIIICVS